MKIWMVIIHSPCEDVMQDKPKEPLDRDDDFYDERYGEKDE